jgi:signal transduction histidine kinase
LKLLIAEDDVTSRLMLESTTSRWDFQPEVYEDGDQAWSAIRAEDPPHLLLLDWEMPGASGVEICRRIRELPNNELYYIVLLTSRGSTEDLVKGLESGANDYIRKPFSAEELEARLNVGRRMIELQQQRIQQERENARLQRELLESRKMEALGQITGSIAHDFNNILGIIMGYTSMTISRYREQMPEKMLTYLEASLSSSERAKDLVAKMLTFSHGEEDESPEHIQLAPVVEQAVHEYKATVPENIDLELLIHDDLPEVHFSAAKVRKVIEILCDNSVESMPSGGTIQIKLSKYQANEEECSDCHRIFSGTWVLLEVIDQGKGIDSSILDRVYEPFFTTKEFGKGMGLAMIHGMFRRSNAHSKIEQLSPRGTRMQIFFPPEEH